VAVATSIAMQQYATAKLAASVAAALQQLAMQLGTQDL